MGGDDSLKNTHTHTHVSHAKLRGLNIGQTGTRHCSLLCNIQNAFRVACVNNRSALR